MMVDKNIREAIESFDCDLYEDERIRAWASNYYFTQRWRHEYVCELVQRHCPAGRVAEVGAAPGQLAYYLSHCGRDVTAFDLYPEPSRRVYESAGVPAIRWNIEQDDPPPETGEFQCVLLLEVLEHLRIDPLQTMRRIGRLLSSDGVLILSTPNLYRLRKIVGYLRGRGIGEVPSIQFGRLEETGFFGHIRRYGFWEIEDILKASGFRPLDRRRHSPRPTLSEETKRAEGPFRWSVRHVEWLAEQLLPFGRHYLYVLADRG